MPLALDRTQLARSNKAAEEKTDTRGDTAQIMFVCLLATLSDSPEIEAVQITPGHFGPLILRQNPTGHIPGGPSTYAV